MEVRLMKLARLMRGWVQYYKMADMKTLLKELDMWIRRRLRAVRWKEWKKILGMILVKKPLSNFVQNRGCYLLD